MGVTPGMGNKYFSSAKRPDSIWGPPSFLFGGSPNLKRPVRETDYSSFSSTEVKTGWIYTPNPLTSLYDVHRNDFTFAGSEITNSRVATC